MIKIHYTHMHCATLYGEVDGLSLRVWSEVRVARLDVMEPSFAVTYRLSITYTYRMEPTLRSWSALLCKGGIAIPLLLVSFTTVCINVRTPENLSICRANMMVITVTENGIIWGWVDLRRKLVISSFAALESMLSISANLSLPGAKKNHYCGYVRKLLPYQLHRQSHRPPSWLCLYLLQSLSPRSY